MTELTLRGIRKTFGSFVALDAIDLDVRSGELVSLLGPSGCGKTTTLRLIAGLDVPTSGQILFSGRDVSQVPIQQRNVGMVFQRYALFPHMNVERNVSFGLRVRGTDKNEVAKRLDEILDVVQLGEFRHRFPAQLSGGQMQRVAIARTLITNPAVLMMDEPLANLDVKLRTEMRSFIRGLQRRLGITMIFVTHDQVEALELSDRVAVMFGGRIEQYDAPAAIYHRPRTAAVARFFGLPNFFTGRLEIGAGACQVASPFGRLAVGGSNGATGGETVSAMIRSESIVLCRDGETPPDAAPPQNRLAGRIETIDFFGAAVSYGVRVDGALLRADEMSNRQLKVGEPVVAAVPPDRIWIIRDPDE